MPSSPSPGTSYKNNQPAAQDLVLLFQWTGTAPVDVSSGDHQHHRLSRGGNREINRVLHMMAVVQLLNPTEVRAYYNRKRAEGKSPNEAMRALKRRLSDIVYRTC